MNDKSTKWVRAMRGNSYERKSENQELLLFERSGGCDILAGTRTTLLEAWWGGGS